MRNLWHQAKWVFTLCMLGAVGIFAAQNTAQLDLDFLIWSFQSRRFVVLAATLGIGLLIGWLFGRSRSNN